MERDLEISIREKVVAELLANPARTSVAAERLGVTRDVVCWHATRDKRIGVVGHDPTKKGMTAQVFGPVGGSFGTFPRQKGECPDKKSHKANWPRRLCLATETAAVVACDVKRIFGRANRTKAVTVYVKDDTVYVTTPERYSGDLVGWIGTYVPSTTRREIFEDYTHHLEKNKVEAA